MLTCTDSLTMSSPINTVLFLVAPVSINCSMTLELKKYFNIIIITQIVKIPLFGEYYSLDDNSITSLELTVSILQQ